MSQVTVYVTNYCPYCNAAEKFLRDHAVPFERVDVTHDPAMRQRLVELTGMRTVPQVFVGERSVGGYTDMLGLHRRGELEPLLEDVGLTLGA